MMSRCNNPNDKDYPGIGGRGVKVCAAWQTLDGFVADMGAKPEGTLMRRLDESADFEPGNVVWMPLVAANTNALYGIWKGVRRRCGLVGAASGVGVRNYLGRGVQMSPEWQDDFFAFEAAVGARPSPEHTLDRVDNDKGYFPGNVRWAMKKTQGNNRHDNVTIHMQGETRTLAEWIDFLGLDSVVVRNKWNNLFSDARAPRKQAVEQRSKDGTFVARHESVEAAAAATGIRKGTLQKCLSRSNMTSGGFAWNYYKP